MIVIIATVPTTKIIMHDDHQMAGPQGGLCEAARAGDLGLVKRLLEQGEQINQVVYYHIMITTRHNLIVDQATTSNFD